VEPRKEEEEEEEEERKKERRMDSVQHVSDNGQCPTYLR
jgi:hypothetical protein